MSYLVSHTAGPWFATKAKTIDDAKKIAINSFLSKNPETVLFVGYVSDINYNKSQPWDDANIIEKCFYKNQKWMDCE